MPGGNLADRLAAPAASATGDDSVASEAGGAVLERLPAGAARPDGPAMPVMPFPTFRNTPTLSQQAPGNGFESGRDSRAR